MKHIVLFIEISSLIVLGFINASCNRNMESIATDCKTGVVLIRTVEYYELTMSNGGKLYFTGSDFDVEKGEFISLTTEPDSLVPDVFYGTGFFVSGDGRIATNRHVVEGDLKEQDARKGLGKIIRELEEYLQQTKGHYELCLSSLLGSIIYNPDTILGYRQALLDAYELYEHRLNEVKQMLRSLEHNDPKDISLTYHNEVRIAYDNTFVRDDADLKPCTIRAKSEKDDLAIIQLNTKQTPVYCHVFELTPNDMIQHYSFFEYLMHLIKRDKNSTIMMIGYNYGLGLATTDEGITTQHPMGNISRYIADEREVQYDIPALEGSSGAPVINRRGQVVAINYASGDTATNRFNYGVKEKYLYELNKNL